MEAQTMSPTPGSIDINSDVGESFGSWAIGADDELFPLISSANVACGFHAGDPRVMERTVNTLAGLGVAVGAHPGFPDLVGFGRREMHPSPDELRTDVMYQIGALKAFCEAVGVPLHHVKPHGAMYNMAAKDEAMAGAIAQGIVNAAPEALVYAQDGSALATAAHDAGLRIAYEVFADRGYLSDGRLAPRSRPDAMLHDPTEVSDRVIRMTRGQSIPTVDGGPIVVRADTVCIHSDTPAAVAMARALREALDTAGIVVRAAV
jgi:5-oxoprolinase (ATP-hydrolysing) subunit A